MKTSVIAVILVTVLSGATAGYLVGTSARATLTATSLTTVSSVAYQEPAVTTVASGIYVTFHTTLNACNSCSGGGTFTYPLSLNYSGGPWILHYWVQNYSGTQNSISGNLVGSGNSSIWITFYVGGYVQYTLCASATKAPNDSPQLYNLPLTLSSLGQNVTTKGSTAETCSTLAV
jgi:hypothetical protein